MAHFAEIDKDKKVLRVLVVPNEQEKRGQTYLAKDLGLGGTWLQTSYNSKIRGTFAGKNFTYNEEEDIFVTPQPYPSWIREGSFWNAPISMPQDDARYLWNEQTLSWDVLDETLAE